MLLGSFFFNPNLSSFFFFIHEVFFWVLTGYSTCPYFCMFNSWLYIERNLWCRRNCTLQIVLRNSSLLQAIILWHSPLAVLGKRVVSEIRLKAFFSPLSLRWDCYGLTFYIVTASVQFLLKQKPTSVCKHRSLLILLVMRYYLPALFHCDIATLDAGTPPYCPRNCFSPGECLAPTNLFQSAWQKNFFFCV